MDDFEKFSDTLIPEREDFYSHLNMDDINNVDYAHKKRVCKDKIFRRISWIACSKWYIIVRIENIRNMCLKIYGFDPAKFLSSPGLRWQATLEKTEVELELSTDFDMLFTVEKVITRGICHAIHRYTKNNN